jgi:hypothetical protein
MKRIRIIGLCLLAAFATAAVASASASAELPEYMVCGKAAKVGKVWQGHYSSALCTEASKVETGGEYELEKGTGKKATFTASAGESIITSAEVPNKMECKSTTATGEFTGSKEVKNVVLKSSGCEEDELQCRSAGLVEGRINTNHLKGEFGYIAGKGTKAPTIGLLLVQESTSYAAEFECAEIQVRTKGPIIAEVSGDVNAISTESTYTFRQSDGVQQYSSFEGGLPDEQWRWEFNVGKGFEPEGGDAFGIELTAAAKGEAMEIKA